MKQLIRELTPPILLKSVLRLSRTFKNYIKLKRKFEYGAEQSPEFYDETFNREEHWKVHYSESRYYSLWTVIADRIQRAGVKRILDIGCGPGQVACLLRDNGLPGYTGLDFSQERIKRARIVCPEFEFINANVFDVELLGNHMYDCILMTEFLEHVEKDVEVLKKIQSGTTVIATVPNFPAMGHVRHFRSINEVRERYAHLFSKCDVTEILANRHGKAYYILQGKI